MSELGQSRHFGRRPTTSGLPLETDIVRVGRHVSKVPFPDSCTAANSYSITSSARSRIVGTARPSGTGRFRGISGPYFAALGIAGMWR
jgi:hypothetical protein